MATSQQPAADKHVVGVKDDATQVRMDGGVGIGAEDSYFSGGAFGRLSCCGWMVNGGLLQSC